METIKERTSSDAETIVKKAWYIFDCGLDMPANNGKFAKKALVDGIEMSIIVKYSSEEACNIITMLPYVESIVT